MRYNFRCLSASLLILFLAVSSIACERPKCPEKYFIPEGYVGWARVFFDVKGTPALAKEGEFTLIKFQQLTSRTTGHLELYTSSPEPDGCNAVGTMYYYYDEDGKTFPIPTDIGLRSGMTTILNEGQGHIGGTDGMPDRGYIRFFVGTTEQLESRVYKIP